jgi:hypothetical protein
LNINGGNSREEADNMEILIKGDAKKGASFD